MVGKKEGRMLLDKKGDLGDVTMFLVYMFFMTVIGVGIFGGMYIFFVQGYEFREVDAEILSYKIQRCIMDNEIDDSFRDKFYEMCKIDKDVVDKYSLIKVCRNSDDCVNERSNEGILIGEGSKYQACRFEGGKENDAFPKCVNTVFVKGRERFEIITGSTQISRRGIG